MTASGEIREAELGWTRRGTAGRAGGSAEARNRLFTGQTRKVPMVAETSDAGHAVARGLPKRPTASRSIAADRQQRVRRRFIPALCLLAVSASGIGYLLGHAGGADLSRPRVEGQRVGQARGRAVGWHRGSQEGFLQGRRAAYPSAYQTEYRATTRRLASTSSAAGAPSARSTSGTSSSTASSAPSSGGRACLATTPVCEVAGPGVTGEPCPPDSVPNADGGVLCVPN